MKKWLIGSLVGAIILFGWQFISWGPSNLHGTAYGYTAQQDTILKALSAGLQEDGQYMIPGLKPGTSRDEQEKMWKENEGKPWAMVQYHKSARVDMAKPMTRGFLIDLVIVVLLIFIFGKMSAANFMDILFSTLAIGFASWLWFPYTGHNWFETPMSVIQPDLIDIVVGWLLLGAWLGFWLRRK